MRKQTWRGIPGTRFLYLNEWADPEIGYCGKVYDAVEVEDTLRDMATDEVGCELDDDEFNDWLSEHKEDVYEALDEIDPVGSMYDSDVFNDTVIKHNRDGEPIIITAS